MGSIPYDTPSCWFRHDPDNLLSPAPVAKRYDTSRQATIGMFVCPQERGKEHFLPMHAMNAVPHLSTGFGKFDTRQPFRLRT